MGIVGLTLGFLERSRRVEGSKERNGWWEKAFVYIMTFFLHESEGENNSR